VKPKPVRPSQSVSADRAARRESPRERLLREGAHGLADAEILQMLLGYALPRKSLQPPVEELIRRFMDLEGVLHASAVELCEVAGVERDSAALIRLAGEIAFRLAVKSEGLRHVLNDPGEVERYLVARLSGMREEKLLLVFLNRQGLVLGEEFLGAGTINQVVAFPRQIMEGCLRHRASGLLVVHNHPHGPPIPSVQDREEAERLREILRPFDIMVQDSIVVGHNRCFSIFRNSPLS